MKAVNKDLTREIKKSRSRFLSIMVLIALAVAFLSGLRATAPDMKNTLDEYMDSRNFMDIQVLSTLGLTDDDIEVMKAREGILDGEGSFQLDVFAKGPDNDIVVKLWAIPERINVIQVRQGRMPENERECLADKKLMSALGLEVGDTISFRPEDGDEDKLISTDFTIAGEAVSPYYISVERGSASIGIGEVAAFAYLPPECFDMDYYAAAYFTAEDASALRAFGDEYTDRIDGLTESLESFADERAELRYSSVVGEAEEKLDDAQKELDDAKKEAEDELADAEKELNDGRKELDDGYEELAEAKETLKKEVLDAEKEIRDGEKDLADGKKELADAEIELADAKKELEDGARELADAKTELEDAAKELADGKKELDDALIELQDAEKEYADGLKEYEDGVKEYEDGLKEYEDGVKEVADGWDAIKEGDQLLADASRQLAEAKARLDQGIDEYEAGKALLDGFAEEYIVPAFGAAPGLGVVDSDSLGEGLMREGKVGGPVHGVTDSVINGINEQAESLSGALYTLDILSGQALQLEGGIAQAEQAGITAAAFEMNMQLEQVRAGITMIEAGFAAQGMTVEEARMTEAMLQETIGQLPASAAELRENYELLAASRQELDAGIAQYEAGYAEYEDGVRASARGEEKLRKAEKTLKEAKKELADAEKELEDGRKELEDGRKELDDGWAEYCDGVAEYEDGLKEYQDGLREYEDGVREYEDGLKEYNDGLKEYEDGVIELEDGEKELKDARIELRDAVADAEKEIADAEKELADGEIELADGWQEYLDGKAEAEEKIADAEVKIADARDELSKIDSCEWYVLSRDSNPGYLGFGQDADRMANLANVFPMLFFLVAALVCLTTMTRMVEDERVQIGALKALGYSKLAISRKYILYGAIPSLIGAVIGLAIGYTLFPTMIFTAYQIMYEVPRLHLAQYIEISVFSVAAALACTTLSTLWACFTTLNAVPAELMRPKAPKAGKRVLLEYIKPLWSRMGFFSKLTARNLLRYQKRFWMTILGIGGCTALIIAGFGLRSSLLDTMDRQYGQIFKYEVQLTLGSGADDDDRAAIEEFFDGRPEVVDHMACRLASVTCQSDTYSVGGYMQVCSPDKLDDYVDVHDFETKQHLTLDDSGVLIGKKLSELLDIGVGDTFTIDSDGRFDVTVAGITEHYLGHYIYMTPACYEDVFGKAYETNAYQLNLTSDDEEVCNSLFSDYLKLDGTASASRIQNTRDTYMHSMERIDFVVVIVILSAAALAVVVLYNLSNINITERRRELATIKVLGFYDGEVSAYIYRENIVLTVLGIAFGILIGHWLHSWLVVSVEIDLMMFGRETDPRAYLWAALLTAAFSALVNVMAHKRLKQIDMVESLKSAE